MDSEGVLLKAYEEEDGRVGMFNAGDPPNPERLRLMLVHALRKRGQQWDDDAPLNELISVAEATWDAKLARDPFSRLLARLFPTRKKSSPR